MKPHWEYVAFMLSVLVFLVSIASVGSAYKMGVRDTFSELNEPGRSGGERVREQIKDECLTLKH
jgi:hypothetical protein